MPNEVVQTQETAPEQLPTASAAEEFIYKYQPRDDEGRALGGEQVIKAVNMQEALDKMAQQNSELLKMARKLKRDAALGTMQPEEAIPDSVERVLPGAYEFHPRDLSAEEKWKITRDLDNPETADEAFDKLIEARLGAKPGAISQTLSQAQQDIAALRTQQEARAFIDATSDYYICPENAKTLMAWMLKNNLAPKKDNFEFAFRRLQAAGLLLDAPIAAEESQANAQPESGSTGRITSEEQTPTKRPAVAASGLNRHNSSTTGGVAKKSGYSEAEISRMTTHEYRQKVLEPLLRNSKR